MNRNLLAFVAAATLSVPQIAAAGSADVTYLVCTRGPQGTGDGSSVATVTLDPVTMHDDEVRAMRPHEIRKPRDRVREDKVLRVAPGVTVVATSREPLAVPGEHPPRPRRDADRPRPRPRRQLRHGQGVGRARPRPARRARNGRVPEDDRQQGDPRLRPPPAGLAQLRRARCLRSPRPRTRGDGEDRRGDRTREDPRRAARTRRPSTR